MSGRMVAAFGGIVLMALAGLDYGSAANGRPQGNPLGVTEHVMVRFAQAKVAVGFAPAPASTDAATGAAMAALIEVDVRLAPTMSAEGQIEAALAAAEADAAAPPPEPDGAAAIEGKGPAAKDRPARKKPGQITVGVGSCTKSGAGKFCSVGGS